MAVDDWTSGCVQVADDLKIPRIKNAATNIATNTPNQTKEGPHIEQKLV